VLTARPGLAAAALLTQRLERLIAEVIRRHSGAIFPHRAQLSSSELQT